MRTSITDVKLIDLPKIEDPRGNLSFLEEENHVPFKIELMAFFMGMSTTIFTTRYIINVKHPFHFKRNIYIVRNRSYISSSIVNSR